MSFDDVQMDVLLRRHGASARDAKNDIPAQHLDADEMSAFAEGVLSAAARARYVSHLADCDDCRKMVSQLAVAAGAVARVEPAGALPTKGSAWREKLAAIFRPPTLRYAAFAVVLVAASGIALVVIKQQRQQEHPLVARNEPASERQVSAVKPYEDGAASPAPASNVPAEERAKTPPVTTSTPKLADQEAAKADESLAPLAKPMKQSTEAEEPAAKKEAQPSIAELKPTYAPPPPEETQQRESVTVKPGGPLQSRQQQALGGQPATQSRKTESDKLGDFGRAQTGDTASNTRAKDDNKKLAQNSPTVAGATDEKQKGPRRDVDNTAVNRNANESRDGVVRTETAGSATKTGPDAGETRSVGGRKFRRQGNGWVDAKFKSSMTLKSIARSSDEFSALDGGLRSIAQQLGGEVIVVWKGKAYQIH
jgi:Putative zinc-finger